MNVRVLSLAAAAALALSVNGCSSDSAAPAPPPPTDSGTDSTPTDTGTDTGTPTDSGSDSPSDSPGDTPGDTASGPTCAAYCDKITTACTGTNAQYTSKDDCLKQCGTNYGFPAGTGADTSGDTIGCRTYHAGVAGTDAPSAVTHCPHAGASGGNTCGAWCDVYCDTVQRNCVGANKVYTDATTCKAACAAFPTTGKPNDTAGNTVQCRIYHAGAAGADAASATLHCPHTGVTSSTCI